MHDVAIRARKLLAQHGLVVLLQAAGLFAFLLVQWPQTRAAGLLLTSGTLAGIWWTGRSHPADVGRSARLVASCALLTAVSSRAWNIDTAATAGLLITIAATTSLDAPWRKLALVEVDAFQLPRVTVPPQARQPGPWFTTSCLLGSAAGIVLLAEWSLWWWIPLAAAALGWSTGRASRDLRRWRSGSLGRSIREGLDAVAPRFLVHYAGPPEGMYQIRMWLPYLERLGMRYAIVVRDRESLATTAQLTSAPVVLATSLRALQAVLPESARVVFYVNHENRNADGVRLADRVHVHLGHGDSDKPASYVAPFAMFDRIFVAGQAAIDRFADHGVVIPQEKFRIVGRPQTEAILAPVSPPRRPPTVLYAPTWTSGLQDMRLGSLAQGLDIVAALVGLGARVLFRPHPFSARDAQSRVAIARIDDFLEQRQGDHLTSQDCALLPIFECFNRSDAMVADISSVVSDYLASGKPFAVNVADLAGDPHEVYPVTAGAYVLHSGIGDDLVDILRAMLTDDPLRDERIRMRRHYLGEFEPAESPTVFVAAVREALLAAEPGKIPN